MFNGTFNYKLGEVNVEKKSFINHKIIDQDISKVQDVPYRTQGDISRVLRLLVHILS